MEIRKDYIEDRWVIINPNRKNRPNEFKKIIEDNEGEECFFCTGNENKTPNEIGRIGDDKQWKMRWFENKFPVVNEEGNANITVENKYFTHTSAYGKHEIVVETNDHHKQLWDLSSEEIKTLFDVYNRRIENLSRINGIKYVSVFKNHGKMAGTSIKHSHSQIIAYNIIPNKITKIIKALKQYHHCPYCEIIEIEKKGERRVFEDENIVAFCPYASRFNYEVWIYPKRHINKLSMFEEKEKSSLSYALKYILERLKNINAEYNYYLNYSENEIFHFHIRINPRIAIWAGFEWSTDCIINSVAPEAAAKYYRGEE